MNQPPAPTPAKMYEKHIVPAIFIPWTKLLLEKASPQSGDHVLDLACGTGIIARHVAPIVGSSGKVYAIDINQDMLRVGSTYPRPKGATIEWLQADAIDCGLTDDSVDFVICQQGLQFFADCGAGVREMARVLKKGGTVLVETWQALHHHPVWEAVCESEVRHFDVKLAEVAKPWSMGSSKELRSYFEEAGFSQIEIIPESIKVHFPSAEQFIELTMTSAASVIPELRSDSVNQEEVVEMMIRDTRETLQHHVNGGRLTFAMSANIVRAHL